MENYHSDFIPVVSVFLVIEAHLATSSVSTCCSGFAIQIKENIQNPSSLFPPLPFRLVSETAMTTT